MPTDPPTAASVSQSLLDRVRVNDAGAWGRLTRLFTPLVYAWVRRAGVPEADAPDVTQEVFLEVARSVGRFRRDRAGDTFTGWVRTIARRRACDHARGRHGDAGPVGGSDAHRQLEQIPNPLTPEPDDTEPVAAVLVRRGLDLIRDEFAANTWQAFERVTLHGRPPADVAAELGMTVGGVYVAKSRVTRRLREELDGLV